MKPTSELNSTRLWSGYYVMIVVFNLFVSIAHYMAITSLPIYVKNLGGDNSSAGLLMGVFTIAALVFRPVYGILIDTKGRKAVLLTGCFLFFTGAILQGAVNSVQLLILLRILQGVGFSAVSTAGGTVVADLVPAPRLSEGIGYYGISLTLATAAGPAIALYLIQKYSFSIMFLCTSLVIFLALILAMLLNYEKKLAAGTVRKISGIKKEIDEKENIISKLKKIVSSENKALIHAWTVFFVALGYGSVLTFLPVYAESKGITNIGMYYAIYAGAILTTRLCTGKLADRIGITPVIVPSMGLMIIAFGVLAFTETLSLLLIVAVLFGLGFGTVTPLLNTLILKSYPPDKRGAANALYFSAMDIGIAAGSIVWGIVSQHFGFYSIYLASAGSIIVSYFVYLSYYRSGLYSTHIINEGKI